MSKKLEVKFQAHIKLFLHRDKSKIRLYKYGGVSRVVYISPVSRLRAIFAKDGDLIKK